MDLNKTRDRSSEELLIRKNEFLKICDVLNELNINYFLQTGVLLGAVREQNFVKWDWGVDISVFTDEFFNKIDPLTELLKKAEFKILDVKKNKNDFKVYFMGECPIDVTGYTVFAWNYSKIKDVYWRKDYSVPSKFLKNFSTVNLFGRKFKCPSPPEEYLTYAYGNWRKPIRTSDKSLYNSDAYMNKKISFLRNFINKIKKKIYSMLR